MIKQMKNRYFCKHSDNRISHVFLEEAKFVSQGHSLIVNFVNENSDKVFSLSKLKYYKKLI